MFLKLKKLLENSIIGLKAKKKNNPEFINLFLYLMKTDEREYI